jgi:hypothetical protein
MFAQFIRAEAGDEAAIGRLMDRWAGELRPHADGFLGSTWGITTTGEFVAVARFATQEQARRNSERAEQGAWWAELEKAFAGPASFLECSDVDVSMGGGSDDAGFVQVMLGHGDRERVRAAIGELEEIMRRERPDIIGGITLWSDDGAYIDVAYFTSEAEARAGESKEVSEDMRRFMEQFMDVAPVEEFLDIPQPRLV